MTAFVNNQVATSIRVFKLCKHDVMTVKWANEKDFLGMPIIIHKVYYDRIWHRPSTWFKKCYMIEYIGDNYREVKSENYVQQL